MTKHVILLKGTANSGKTQTLLKLIDKLQEANFQDKKVVNNCCQKDCEDKRIVIDYKKFRIAICTGGDTEDILNKNIDYFKSCSWHIAICATRSKGKMIDVIKEFAQKQDAQIHIVRKGWVDDPEWSDNPRQQEACDLLIESTAQVMKIIIDGWIGAMIPEKS
ncbi:hypothetical protein NG821_09285 [Prevotella cerevisiae]|uniref:Uncharacterized protein n=1 Tax=Segatella cerevisiae TaxID=2053716 RepID=A0ABT1C0M6_9BACT|nr:hypothetical protein [Segatella cerevisiae]MCO6026028.1 hypothetical protein [Segatella cerevisiae]